MLLRLLLPFIRLSFLIAYPSTSVVAKSVALLDFGSHRHLPDASSHLQSASLGETA